MVKILKNKYLGRYTGPQAFRYYTSPLYLGSKSTIHSIPNLSLNIPKYEPQGLSLIVLPHFPLLKVS